MTVWNIKIKKIAIALPILDDKAVPNFCDNIVNIVQSINQTINLYRAVVQRRAIQCGYAESKRNVKIETDLKCVNG